MPNASNMLIRSLPTSATGLRNFTRSLGMHVCTTDTKLCVASAPLYLKDQTFAWRLTVPGATRLLSAVRVRMCWFCVFIQAQPPPRGDPLSSLLAHTHVSSQAVSYFNRACLAELFSSPGTPHLSINHNDEIVAATPCGVWCVGGGLFASSRPVCPDEKFVATGDSQYLKDAHMLFGKVCHMLASLRMQFGIACATNATTLCFAGAP